MNKINKKNERIWAHIPRDSEWAPNLVEFPLGPEWHPSVDLINSNIPNWYVIGSRDNKGSDAWGFCEGYKRPHDWMASHSISWTQKAYKFRFRP